MGFFSILHIALRAVSRNKLRSLLTTLGVVIGVGAVIAMVAIGEGARARVQQTFAAMGTNLLIVMSGSSNQGGARGGFGSQPTLTQGDLQAIQTEIPSVRSAAPSLHASAQVQSDGQNWNTTIEGTTPEFFDVRSWQTTSGRILSAADLETGAKVCVVGRTVVDKLFGGSDPVGQSMRIRSMPFQVVGVLAKKGQSPMGQDYDDVLLIPESAYLQRFAPSLGDRLPGVIFVAMRSSSDARRTLRKVASLLRDRHHLADGADDDFSVLNLSEIANAEQQGTQTLTLLLAGIAAVSLVVGGIGIMNIMLVSVTERTREIGIRMAIGATPGQIRAQFLVEALTLSALGGLVGVVAGVAAGMGLASRFGWPFQINADVIVIAVVFSAGVGVGFGLYPAQKASRLDPIDALRYE
jgi:putative ABC transport system permease protein